MTNGRYSIHDVMAITGVSRSRLKRWKALGILPPPIPGTGRRYAQYDDSFVRAVERFKREVLDARTTHAEFAERLSYERRAD